MKNTIEFWNKSKKYYEFTEDDSPLKRNPALADLNILIKNNMRVLDIGCGDGSKLIDVSKTKKIQGYGVDVSRIAISLAKRRKTSFIFKKVNSEKLPFENNFFDIVFSTYVFEHLTDPEKVLNEMIRVTKKGGKIVIICPNFGSPLYPSPITPKLKHLIRCIFRDIKYMFIKPRNLEWYPETPVSLNDKTFKPDFDTTILPYVYSLNKCYPKNLIASSVWNSQIGNSKSIRILRYPFKILGLMKIYPFRWWGPICYFVYKK